MKRINLFTVLLAGLLAACPYFQLSAHEPPPNAGTTPGRAKVEQATIFPNTGAAWAEVKASAGDMDKGIAAKNGEATHAAETRLTAALKWLETNSAMVTGDKAKRLAAGLKQALQAADAAHDAADAKDFAKAASEQKKLAGALKLIEAQYPADALAVPKASTAMSMSHGDRGDAHGDHALQPTIRATVTTKQPLVVGAKVDAVIRLTTADGKPVSLDDLAEVHTEKIHLLLIDSSLSDYHHEHPRPTGVSGEYAFSFTPGKPGPYRVWADLFPTATNQQEYVIADIGSTAKSEAITNRNISTSAKVAGFAFEATIDPPDLVAGQDAMMKVAIRGPDGQPFGKLEPVMGAFAHMVGFVDDYKTIAHIHPLGEEPTKATDRGGPALEFHMKLEQAGLMRLFVQVQIDGKNVFAPITVNVAPAATANATAPAPNTRNKSTLPVALTKAVADYGTIQKSLVGDSFDGVVPAANALMAEAKANPDVFEPAFVRAAEALATAKDLKSARQAFKPMSNALLVNLTARGGGTSGLFEVYCPMAKSSWIEASRDVHNPYFGSSMQKCGSVKREL